MKPLWQANLLSPLGLAFIGDALWEVYAREHCLNQGVRKPNDLHRLCTKYVSARAQASVLQEITSELTEDEQHIVRKGRNAKSAHARKNVDVQVYRYSTGFESLIGFLHGSGQNDRLEEVVSLALSRLDHQIKGTSS